MIALKKIIFKCQNNIQEKNRNNFKRLFTKSSLIIGKAAALKKQ
jgi:hypothetical protein